MGKIISANINNPHVFGLDARELFFQEDAIVLTEGQEDVVLYPQVARSLGMDFPGRLFGWGVGGVANMGVVCAILRDLGFKRVAGLLDAGQEANLKALMREFPGFFFASIAAADVRTKHHRKEAPEVLGLLDHKYEVRTEYVDHTRRLLENLSQFLGRLD